MEKNVYIFTTFREFNEGDVDTRIQLKFLESLENQKNKNFHFFPIIYNEKNVEKFVSNYKIKFTPIYSNKTKYLLSQNNYWSLSDCLKIISQVEGIENKIILWTLADNLFDENFIEKIVSNFSLNYSGSVFPQLYFKSINDAKNHNIYDPANSKYIKSIFQYNPNRYICDLFFCDGNLFNDNKLKVLIKDKNIFDGVYPGFLLGLIATFGKKNINLYGETFVSTILNDRTKDSFKNNHFNKKNLDKIEKQAKDLKIIFQNTDLKKKYYSGPFRKININSKLQIINKKLKFQFSIFYKIYYILNFFIRSYRFAKNKINKVFDLI